MVVMMLFEAFMMGMCSQPLAIGGQQVLLQAQASQPEPLSLSLESFAVQFTMMEAEAVTGGREAGVADKTRSRGAHTTCAENIPAIDMPRLTCRTAACTVPRRLPATARPVNGSSRPMPEGCGRQSTRRAAPCVASPRPWTAQAGGRPPFRREPRGRTHKELTSGLPQEHCELWTPFSQRPRRLQDEPRRSLAPA